MAVISKFPLILFPLVLAGVGEPPLTEGSHIADCYRDKQTLKITSCQVLVDVDIDTQQCAPVVIVQIAILVRVDVISGIIVNALEG